MFDKPYYRLAFGEGDNLPGLVVDRYADTLVTQINTAGMERVKHEIVTALQEVMRPARIVFRNDSSGRALEGLDNYVETAVGETIERVMLEENGVRFEAPILDGQKTGWFYDHRVNRARNGGLHAPTADIAEQVEHALARHVLLHAGATEVLCVD